MRAPTRTGLYIGLMSGTSLDGVDCALVEAGDSARLVASHFVPFDPQLKAALLALSAGLGDDLESAARLANDLAAIYADAVVALLARSGRRAGEIEAIGCHGQTVRHRPESGFSLQLGNAALVAERTGITVVADFRSRDIAAGGQGAPLVPSFHAACFRSPDRHRAILNIGGIANLTDLPRTGPVRGFDTGPGNLLLDAWARLHLHTEFDAEGRFAASGSVVPELLERMLGDEYFRRLPPKSTGRERFGAQWLDRMGAAAHAAADVQATLAELTAATVATSISRYCPGVEEVFACGGGVHNLDLLRRLRARLGGLPLGTTVELGMDPDWIEATAFAWLAKQALEGSPGNVPEATGARGPRVLGAIYPA